jgi:pimeloyl-ACP methyl ester carboxylesterase
MSELYIQANSLRLAYDEFGSPSDPAMILVMGLGTQMIAWPEDFCRGLAANGYRVIRFDNRDIGLSQKMEGIRTPSIAKTVLLSKIGLPVKVPYKLVDMVADTIGLMDALNIEKAHLIGASMGGMISQLLASRFPNRLLSLTSIMSTSGARSLPRTPAKITRQLMRRSQDTGFDAYLENSIRTYRLIGSPGYMPDDETLRQKITTGFNRSYHPQGYARQLTAIVASGDRVNELKKITAPTLVIHGNADILVPVEGGIDTARHIQQSRLELFDGMGHDLPAALLPRFVELISELAASA